MRNIIRLNDPTGHGGQVISAAQHFKVQGLPVARVGDTCTCPQHGECVIVEGDPNFVIEGRAVAFEGHKTSCGAVLGATTTHFSGK